jgi:hypothetical protein
VGSSNRFTHWIVSHPAAQCQTLTRATSSVRATVSVMRRRAAVMSPWVAVVARDSSTRAAARWRLWCALRLNSASACWRFASRVKLSSAKLMSAAISTSRLRTSSSKASGSPAYRVSTPATAPSRLSGSAAEAPQPKRAPRSCQGAVQGSCWKSWHQNGRFSRSAVPVGPRPAASSASVEISIPAR